MSHSQGPGQSLVEVVRTEDEPAVRGGEAAEVGDVGVAAGLHGDPRVRRRRQVGGHHRRRTAIERERRDEHPPVPDRDELRHARSRLREEDRDRVGPIRRRRPVAMGRAGCDLPRRSAPFGGLARLQCRVRRGGRHGPTVGDHRPGPRASSRPIMRVAAILGRPPGLYMRSQLLWVGSGGNGSTYERGCGEQTAQCRRPCNHLGYRSQHDAEADDRHR